MNKKLVWFGLLCMIAAALLSVISHVSAQTNQSSTTNHTACVKGYYQTQTQYGCCIDGYKIPNFFCYPPQALTVKNCEIAKNGIAKLGAAPGANQTTLFVIKIADKLYNDTCGQVK